MGRFEIEQKEQWREKITQIPFIKFPKHWGISIIPPFGGAIARFLVKKPKGKEKSVYLDWFDRLGCCGSPYWEVYPYRGDVGRCDLNDTKELLRMIKDEKDND